MNPLDFLFNGSSSSATPATPWFQGTTQGVSTFSNGINPASVEAAVDFGGGNLMQYNSINTLGAVGALMGLFNNVLGSGVTNTLNNFLSGGILGLIFPQYAQAVDQATSAYAQSGGGA